MTEICDDWALLPSQSVERLHDRVQKLEHIKPPRFNPNNIHVRIETLPAAVRGKAELVSDTVVEEANLRCTLQVCLRGESPSH